MENHQPSTETVALRKPEPWLALRDELVHALRGVLLLTLLTGVVFPSLLAILALAIFPRQARGSLLERDGVVVGSTLIGQPFAGPKYFHPRPSAAGAGYDATASGGTNLGPANAKLRDGVRQLAEAYRRENGLAADAVLPMDAVTRSGSGLDPHISPANAALQVSRVARVRHLEEETVRALVAENTEAPTLGLLGASRVAVLPLNMALDRAAPLVAEGR
jgi:potassium-transporting ATPase KdpC subunit